MARLLPDAPTLPAAEAWGLAAEHRTLLRLGKELPDDFAVFHSVDWTQVHQGRSVFGEIDFIVMHSSGWLLAIEQKEAEVEVRHRDLVVRYASGGGQESSVTTQLTRNLNGLRNEFARRHPGRRLDVDYLLFLPSTRLAGPLPASIAPERVIDADRADQLVETIRALYEASPPRSDPAAADALTVHEFLSHKVRVTPHIGLLGRSARELTTQLSDGLATWAGRLSLSPWRLRVRGTAGSGKTQLALQELRAARASGVPVLYVCFNRPLADAMRRVAPDPGTVVTFHELARKVLESAGRPPDFSRSDVFDTLAQGFLELAPNLAGTFGTLVIDEGQDMEAAWVQGLLSLARDDARVLWLEDPEQALYRRAPVALPGWATLASPVNYRSPRILVDFINWLRLTDEPIEAGGPVEGFDPLWHVYDEADGPVAATESAIRALREQGFAPDAIAVLSWRGLSKSALAGEGGPAMLAGLRVRRPAGYDAEGNARHTDGELLVETIHRFKGQAADAVVITEIDFEDFDDDARRRLFVGLSRARLHTALVATGRASMLLQERLG